MRRLVLSLLAGAALAVAQPAGWNNPFPAHKIMDNMYYVGTSELASFLFVTPQGLILMNSNYEASVPVIEANMKSLGYDIKDVKILISGHAHPDHIEGDALVKEKTGAQVVVGEREVSEVEKARIPGGKKSPIDRVIKEGETVSLGGTTLTAHLMPGHTPGCLAWSTTLKENGKSYYAFIECSLNGRFLGQLTQYPGIADDFRATYKKALTFPVELWVSSHASFYNLPAKYEKLKARGPNDPNPFVDPDGYKAHVAEYSASFEAALAAPPAQGKGKGAPGGQGKGAAKQ